MSDWKSKKIKTKELANKSILFLMCLEIRQRPEDRGIWNVGLVLSKLRSEESNSGSTGLRYGTHSKFGTDGRCRLTGSDSRCCVSARRVHLSAILLLHNRRTSVNRCPSEPWRDSVAGADGACHLPVTPFSRLLYRRKLTGGRHPLPDLPCSPIDDLLRLRWASVGHSGHLVKVWTRMVETDCREGPARDHRLVVRRSLQGTMTTSPSDLE